MLLRINWVHQKRKKLVNAILNITRNIATTHFILPASGNAFSTNAANEELNEWTD